jgi:hypothetical protein
MRSLAKSLMPRNEAARNCIREMTYSTPRERATYNRCIKEGIFKVGVASQELLTEERGILHIFEQPNAQRILRKMRKSDSLES